MRKRSLLPVRIFYTLIFILFLSQAVQAAVSPEAGEKIFKQKCSSCHLISTKKLVGPGLLDVDKRHSEEWMLKWIRNNAALRASGDKEALDLFAANGGAQMTVFSDFSDDDIKSVLAYIKTGGASATAAKPGAPGEGGTAASGSETDYTTLLLVLVIILAGISLLLARIRKNVFRLSKEKAGEEEPGSFNLIKWLRTRNALATFLLILVVVLGYEMVIGAQKLGHSKGYQPEQPIHFSHRIHAGINKIDCKYCHAGVEKSKTASVPSINICMNCHKAVSEGESPTGTAEINKIYYYAGFNADTKTYDKPQHEVKWIRIHNLPDHVYFNHSQHVVAGKLACQKCHGPIETEDEVYQYTSLSMGWCINCHRNTKVQFKENHYYDGLFENLHDKLTKAPHDSVTVEEIGGTECQRCHY